MAPHLSPSELKPLGIELKPLAFLANPPGNVDKCSGLRSSAVACPSMWICVLAWKQAMLRALTTPGLRVAEQALGRLELLAMAGGRTRRPILFPMVTRHLDLKKKYFHRLILPCVCGLF